MALLSLKIRVPSLAELDHMHIGSSGHICWGCFYLVKELWRPWKDKGSLQIFFQGTLSWLIWQNMQLIILGFKNKFVRYNPPYHATNHMSYIVRTSQSSPQFYDSLLPKKETALQSFPISVLSLFPYSFTSSVPSAFVWCVLSSYNYIFPALLHRPLVTYALVTTTTFLSFYEVSFYGFHTWMRFHSFFLCLFLSSSFCAWLVSLKIMFPRFSHIVTMDRIYFQTWITLIFVCYIFLINLSFDQ